MKTYKFLSNILQQFRKKHHARESFQDEFRQLCKKNGIKIDNCFVWD